MSYKKAALDRAWEIIGLIIILIVALNAQRGGIGFFCILGILSWPIRIARIVNKSEAD